MFFLSWFRRAVRDAFLGGVNDAVEELRQVDDPDADPLGPLRLHLVAAAPGAGEAQPEAKGKATKGK